MRSYDVGDVVRLFTENPFVDENGAPHDPTTVTVKTKAPVTGTVAVYADPIHDGAAGSGLYHKDIQATEPGVWEVRWIATGTPTLQEPDRFYVRPVNI